MTVIVIGIVIGLAFGAWIIHDANKDAQAARALRRDVAAWKAEFLKAQGQPPIFLPPSATRKVITLDTLHADMIALHARTSSEEDPIDPCDDLAEARSIAIDVPGAIVVQRLATPWQPADTP